MGIFDLPPEGERLNDRGFISLSKSENRANPDLYIATICFRRLLAFNFLVYLVCVFIAGFHLDGKIEKFFIFLSWISVLGPFSIVIVSYYVMVFIKNIDQNNFFILRVKGSGKPNPNAIYLVILFPLFISMLLFPDNSMEGVFNARLLSSFKQYFDYYSFVILSGFFWFFAYSTLGVMTFFSSLLTFEVLRNSKIYKYYKGRINR